MSSSAPPKVSFTIRRPTPDSRATSTGAESDDSRFKVPALPRHLTNTNDSTPGSPLGRSAPASPKPLARRHTQRDDYDSSDEDEVIEDELVTGFDQFGVQRVTQKKKPQGPLVIPALQNRDWRELARKRRAAAGLYVPPGAQATTGKDGSVGGLGTKDTINSGLQMEGLQVRKRVKLEADGATDAWLEASAVAVREEVKEEQESEDQRAIRALLASASGEDGQDGPIIDIIPSARRGPTEDDAFKQDVDVLPDEATLNDYERVPVSQFGAALLRGMGWSEGEAASRKKKGMVEPWLPTARPALLGIGAKEREVLDDGGAKTKRPQRPERRYVPVIKKEAGSGSGSGGSREGSASRRATEEPASRGGSRRASRSPEPGRRGGNGRERDDKDRDRDRYRERERDGSKDRDRRRDDRDRRESDRGGDRERDRRRDKSPRSRRRDY